MTCQEFKPSSSLITERKTFEKRRIVSRAKWMKNWCEIRELTSSLSYSIPPTQWSGGGTDDGGTGKWEAIL